MTIDYDHSANLHTIDGPRAALPKLFPFGLPESILDVGCGTGTWLRAAIDSGISDVIGIDGVEIPPDQLLFPPGKFHCRDLGAPVDLGRRFELVICLEVAEHLEQGSGRILIRTLTQHADVILFSAACPGQFGQHHVNCQWPEYWQALFNSEGYACDDSPRWTIWDDSMIEGWYRQNIFMARRDPDAGREPRIKSIIHPEMRRIVVSA
ncbi:MAG TPA: class I SAM-dependent methyltransferase [Verrucomicrobiae bacterium]|nr:class I SAM-dependent methyltransferase [Verrucomicrobiae bacterium]